MSIGNVCLEADWLDGPSRVVTPNLVSTLIIEQILGSRQLCPVSSGEDEALLG